MFNVFLLDMLRISLQIEWQTQMSLFKLLLNLLEWIRNYLLVNVHKFVTLCSSCKTIQYLINST